MIRHCEALFPVRPGNLGQGNQPKQSPSGDMLRLGVLKNFGGDCFRLCLRNDKLNKGQMPAPT
jgi:hypothetical protein